MGNFPRYASVREAIINTPRMFIGPAWDKDGLHILVNGVVNLTIDPEFANECNNAHITLKQNGAVFISDDGRGIPVLAQRFGERPFIEILLEGWVQTGTPSMMYYEEYGFLADYLGGVMAVLSDEVAIETVWDGDLYRVVGARGKILEPLAKLGKADRKGTTITYLPDSEVFQNIQLDAETLVTNLRSLADEYKHVNLRFHDESTGDTVEFS